METRERNGPLPLYLAHNVRDQSPTRDFGTFNQLSTSLPYDLTTMKYETLTILSKFSPDIQPVLSSNNLL